VLDAFSRRVIGSSIADHLRAELVIDALQMAIWRRHPPTEQFSPRDARSPHAHQKCAFPNDAECQMTVAIDHYAS
jgi:transposase InsO family protein